MNRLIRILSLCLIGALLLGASVGCGAKDGVDDKVVTEHIDYAASVTLDMSSETVKQEVTVKSFVDGDTTHFYVPDHVAAGGVLKARYLAVNTPESTGKIEEWGKTAAAYTREKLENAAAIMVESDDTKWNLDSTGGRYLVWVWYKPNAGSEYRNLNIELLQEGLAIASNSANNRYGETCMAAIAQGKAEKLHVHSGQKDPGFPYGEAQELTLKELRTNIKDYEGTKVAFEGVITKNDSNTVYVEEYDIETDMYYGMTVYYGYALNGTGLQILSAGNRVRIVGTVQYYETGGTYQVSGLEYSPMRPDDPSNIKKLGEGFSPAYAPLTAEQLASGTVELTVDDETMSYAFAELLLNTSVSMSGLRVKSVYTTDREDSSSNGAMTLTCEADGVEIAVRTIVLYDAAGKMITAERFEGKTIDVKGLIDYFDGDYQIKVFSVDDITIY